MELLSVSSIIGFIGFVLFVIGLINKNKSWGNKITTVGSILMAIHIVIDASMGGYDGFMGNPHK